MSSAGGYIVYQLKELMRENLIALIYTDPDNPDDFIAGYIRNVNARTLLLASITPFGQPDGFYAIRISTVLDVLYDNVYAERLALLMELSGTSARNMSIREDQDALEALLSMCAENGRAVTVWTATECYSGYVAHVNDLFLELEPVDFMGRRCIAMTFRLIDLDMVSVFSDEEVMYERLDRYHNQVNP
ncbi:MAG: hypothetical protein Q4D04_03075 [Clostridia bacterium]|nr:hypothetical protein [Clostridia bacterium]